MLWVARRLRAINRYWSFLSVFLIVALGVLITIDVLSRALLNKPIVGAYEICQYSLLIVIYASFAYLQSEKGHVSVDLFINKFPMKIRAVVMCFNYLVATAFTGAWAYGAFDQGLRVIKTGNETHLLRIPLAPYYFIEAFSMILFCLVLLVDTITLAGAIFNKELASEVLSWGAGSTN